MRTFSAGRTRPAGGFTLLEMVVVLILLAVAATLVFGINVRQKDRLVLQEFGTSFCAYLQLARSAALAEGRRKACLVDREAMQIFSPGLGRSVRIPEGAEIRRVNPLRPEGNGTERLMEYYMDGSSSGGEIELSYGENTGLIEVDPLLGQTRLRW